MRKAAPIWQDLPIHFKRDVVGYLDIKSRRSLQICSEEDQDLVLSSPTFLEDVTLCPPNKIIINFKICTASENDLIEIFMRTFQNPKSFVELVKFSFHDIDQQEAVKHFLPLLLERMESEPKFKINCKIFDYDGLRSSPLGKDFLDVLKFCNSKKMRILRIAPQVSDDYLSEFFETEQWKNAEELRSFGLWSEETELEPFLRFRRLNMQHIHFLTAKNAWKIIKTFLDRNHPVDSCFYIKSLFDFKLQGILNQFHVPPKNEPIVENEYFKHTQTFELPSTDNVMVLKIANAGIYGAVCRKTQMEVDFRWAVFRVRIQE
ncbi:unnamed protein product [Caenorhabditis brenneri]